MFFEYDNWQNSFKSSSRRIEKTVPAKDRLSRLKARRKLWLDVHLYLGLIAGAALAVIGLTGSILVFYQGVDESLNPELLLVAPSPGGMAAYRPLPEILAAAETAIPNDGTLGYARFPVEPEQAFIFYFHRPSLSESEKKDFYHLTVNPYTAKVIGTRLAHRAGTLAEGIFINFIFRLHYLLLLEDSGLVVVGILGVLLIISVLTGLIVWWPLTGRFRQALSVKRNAGKVRLNFDLHKTSGFYSALVLLAVLLSGVYMNLPDHFKAVVGLFSPLTEPGKLQSRRQPGQLSITAAKALAIAEQAYPEGRVKSIGFPKLEHETYRINKSVPDEISRFIDSRVIAVDRYSGEILNVYDAETGSGGDVFLQWQWPLHSGKAFGWSGRILVFISGVLCVLLYVTGVIRWLQKRNAKTVKREKRRGLAMR